ncbi:BON domain-containing protein [Pseudomonas sp. PDM14]|uniref:BON domain-containing protein n=1 Tax=Pseudomonas sp. PDM14 TaxID=2769288 RepID=UPI001783EA08|nr:BON domain-containing protein [Pseudomonas sp. PDM14]MBD9483416.1 BON domain-containing protein [Pseudomonas sp. PDM14]
MPSLKTLALAVSSAAVFGLTPLTIHAAEGAVSREVSEARQEGSIWTAMALNRHLNPFDIGVDVENGTARLTGKVETQVEKDLAEQVALSIEGVDEVDNQLQLDAALKPRESGKKLDFAQRFDDASLTATVKSKLLWNSSTEALDIAVKTEHGVVTLSGQAGSAAAKELAGQLAQNTNGVQRVNNLLSISSAGGTLERAQAEANDASAAISDAWITSKVKSSLFYNRRLDGLDISVATDGGTVSLTGTVPSSTEKLLAVETAQNIRGVREVQADALRVVDNS